MLCRDIINIIEKKFPENKALEWDNVGLLTGRDDKDVKKIFLALDPTDQIIDLAIAAGADMLITHHPLIFTKIQKVNNIDFVGRRVLKLAQNDISYYAMHTNYDICGMAELSAKLLYADETEVLDITGSADGVEEGIGRVFHVTQSLTLKALCELVKAVYELDCVRVFGDLDTEIHRVAICPGAGKSDIPNALALKADAYITGDIGHHDGLDAIAQGMAVIDAGHYGIEHIFIHDMSVYLKDMIPELVIEEAPVIHPFQTV